MILAVLTMIGLVAALTGDGWRDACGWLGMLAPVVAVGNALVKRR